jgi:hypothetical protein
MHRLYSNDKSTVIELNAQAGQTYYVRVDMKRGVWKYRGALTLVDAQQGEGQFAKQPLDVTRDLSGQSPPSASVRATKYPATRADVDQFLSSLTVLGALQGSGSSYLSLGIDHQIIMVDCQRIMAGVSKTQ